MGGAASPPDGETEEPPPRHNPELKTRRKTYEANKTKQGPAAYPSY